MNKLLRQKIAQLKQEKEQLRLFLHEIIEAYYRVVNKPKTEPTTDNESPCPANLYSFFGQAKLCSCKPKTKQEKQHFKDCSLSLLKDFYEQINGEKQHNE